MNDLEIIKNKIYEIRGQRVMLDRDLAAMYGVTTGSLNQSVKRNIDRFPEDFMFRLSDEETKNWKSQIVISNQPFVQVGEVQDNPQIYQPPQAIWKKDGKKSWKTDVTFSNFAYYICWQMEEGRGKI